MEIGFSHLILYGSNSVLTPYIFWAYSWHNKGQGLTGKSVCIPAFPLWRPLKFSCWSCSHKYEVPIWLLGWKQRIYSSPGLNETSNEESDIANILSSRILPLEINGANKMLQKYLEIVRTTLLKLAYWIIETAWVVLLVVYVEIHTSVPVCTFTYHSDVSNHSNCKYKFCLLTLVFF